MSKYKYSRDEAAERIQSAIEGVTSVQLAVKDPYTVGLLRGYEDALGIARDFILEKK